MTLIALGILGGLLLGLVVGYVVGQAAGRAATPDPRPRAGYVRCACGSEYPEHLWHECPIKRGAK